MRAAPKDDPLARKWRHRQRTGAAQFGEQGSTGRRFYGRPQQCADIETRARGVRQLFSAAIRAPTNVA